MESVRPRMRDGRQAFFLFLPEGEDPDTLVRSEGATGLDARLQQATPLSQFLFDSLAADDVNLSPLDGKARLAERAKPMLAQIQIGRPSGRERVCQYVSIQVVDVSLKKK